MTYTQCNYFLFLICKKVYYLGRCEGNSHPGQVLNLPSLLDLVTLSSFVSQLVDCIDLL